MTRQQKVVAVQIKDSTVRAMTELYFQTLEHPDSLQTAPLDVIRQIGLCISRQRDEDRRARSGLVWLFEQLEPSLVANALDDAIRSDQNKDLVAQAATEALFRMRDYDALAQCLLRAQSHLLQRTYEALESTFARHAQEIENHILRIIWEEGDLCGSYMGQLEYLDLILSKLTGRHVSCMRGCTYFMLFEEYRQFGEDEPSASARMSKILRPMVEHAAAGSSEFIYGELNAAVRQMLGFPSAEAANDGSNSADPTGNAPKGKNID